MKENPASRKRNDTQAKSVPLEATWRVDVSLHLLKRSKVTGDQIRSAVDDMNQICDTLVSQYDLLQKFSSNCLTYQTGLIPEKILSTKLPVLVGSANDESTKPDFLMKIYFRSIKNWSFDAYLKFSLESWFEYHRLKMISLEMGTDFKSQDEYQFLKRRCNEEIALINCLHTRAKE